MRGHRTDIQLSLGPYSVLATVALIAALSYISIRSSSGTRPADRAMKLPLPEQVAAPRIVAPAPEKGDSTGPVVPHRKARPALQAATPLPPRFTKIPDSHVLLALLGDLANDPDFKPNYLAEENYIRINNLTNENTKMSFKCDGKIYHSEQIDSYIPGELYDHYTLPDDMVADLKRRNREPVPLQGFDYRSRAFRVERAPDPLDESRALRKVFDPHGPKAWISVWLPGYSKDGGMAVVCFAFAPSPHGAGGAYVLERRADGRWAVVRRVRYSFA